MATREEMLQFIEQRLAAMPPEARDSLLAMARKRAATKKLAKKLGARALSTREDAPKFDPAHPERYVKNAELARANLKEGVRELAQAAEALSPSKMGALIRRELLGESTGLLYSPMEGQHGGILESGSAPGDTPSSTLLPPSRATLSGQTAAPPVIPVAQGRPEGGRGAVEAVTEFVAGSLPYKVGKAFVETPTTPLGERSFSSFIEEQKLRFQRAKGQFDFEIDTHPLMGAVEIGFLPSLAKGVVAVTKGTIKGGRSVFEIARDLHLERKITKADELALQQVLKAEQEAAAQATGRLKDLHARRAQEVAGLLGKVAQQKAGVQTFEATRRAASERIFDRVRAVGASIATRKSLTQELAPFADELARATNEEAARMGKAVHALTREDLQRIAEQVALEAQNRRMFPYSPIPRPEQPQTIRDLFRALPDRAFTGVPPQREVTGDDIIQRLLPDISSFEPQVNVPLLPMKVRIGGKYVDGVAGQGFVMQPGKMLTAQYDPSKVRVLAGGGKDLSKAGKFPRVRKGGRVGFRPQAATTPPTPSAIPPVTKAGAVTDEAAPVVAQVVAADNGAVAFKSNFARDLLVSVEKNVKHPMARSIVSQFKRSFEDHHNLAGEWMSTLGKTISGTDPEFRSLVMREMMGEATANPQAKKLAEDVQMLFIQVEDEIKALAKDGNPLMVRMPDGSWRPWQGRMDFGAPRKLNSEWRDAVWADTKEAFKQVREQIGKNADNDRVVAALDGLHEKMMGRADERTQKVINALIARHWVQSPGEAWAYAARHTYDDMYRYFGHVDAHRTPFFPLEAYSTDFDEVIPEYLYGVARRIAESRQFGGQGQKLRAQLTALKEAGRGEEAEYLSKIGEIHFGDAGRQFAQDHPTLQSVYNAYSKFSVVSKIGLGTATIPNLTQFMISTVPVLGVGNTLKGAMKLVFNKGYVNELGRYGVTMQEIMQTFIQEEFGGVSGHVSNIILKPFTGANRMQKLIAAAAMDSAFDDLVRAGLNGDGKALRMMGRLGINPKEVATEAGMQAARKRAIFRFAAESQLQREPVLESLMLGKPAGRIFTLFKRFGYRQAKFINDWVLTEARHKNYAPLLRLAASGWLGGELVGEAKRELREFLRGQPGYDPPKGLLGSIAQAWADVGSFGVFSDLMRFDGVLPEFWMKELVENATFAIAPLPVSDIGKGLDVIGGGAIDIGKRGLKAGGRRAVLRGIGRLGGSLLGYASHAWKSAGQVANEVLSRRNARQQDINVLIIKGDWEKAIEVARDWNGKFGQRGEGYMVKMPANASELVKLWLADESRMRDLTPEQRQALMRLAP